MQRRFHYPQSPALGAPFFFREDFDRSNLLLAAIRALSLVAASGTCFMPCLSKTSGGVAFGTGASMIGGVNVALGTGASMIGGVDVAFGNGAPMIGGVDVAFGDVTSTTTAAAGGRQTGAAPRRAGAPESIRCAACSNQLPVGAFTDSKSARALSAALRSKLSRSNWLAVLAASTADSSGWPLWLLWLLLLPSFAFSSSSMVQLSCLFPFCFNLCFFTLSSFVFVSSASS